MTNPGEGLICKAREAAGLTRAQLADLAGVHQSTVAFAEESRWPGLRVMTRYAGLLGYEVRVCLVRVGNPQDVID